MSRSRVAFFVAVAGGLFGYACGAVLNQPPASAQQSSTAADAGPAMGGGTGGMGGSSGSGTGGSGSGSGSIGGSGTGGGNPGTPGQPPAPACSQWEVKLMRPSHNLSPGDTDIVEQGWEPYAWSDSWSSPILRRCIH